MSDSDNDDLPTLSKFKFIFGGTRKKTFDELFNEASNLIQNLESEPHHLEQTEEISVQETQDDNLLINESVLDEDYDCDTFRELSVRLFGESNHLQFFTWDDLTLENCGLNATLDLSEQERVLVTLNEVELLKEIECCETFSLKKFKQLKPFVQYALKSMSIHPDEGYVRACQKFIKRTIFQWHHIKDLSISYTVIFTALFNYGVDVKTKIFNVLPGVKDVKRTEFVNEIPRDYVCNLKAVLSSISDLMKHCKMEEEDLYNILIYLLCMSLDDFVKINSHLQQCTAIILWRFSNTEWPFWRLKIAQFVLSTYTQMNNEWNSAIKMIQCITNDELRGFELRNYISYLVLVKLTDKPNSSVIPEYSKKLFRIQRLQPILESTSDIEKRLQFAAIKFINLFTNSLKLSNKEEHRKLCILLKKCETSISKHATIQQSQLCIIHSRISIMAPPESLKRVQDYVSGKEGDISEYESESDSNAILPASDELSNQSFADNDSSDMLENENINSEDSITNQRSKKITEENPSSSLNEQFVDDYEMKSVCETSNEVNEPKGLVSYDANDTLKNISNESQEITEKSPPCSLNEQFIDDHKVKSVCETPFGMKDIQIALEITVNNAVQCSPEKNYDDKLEKRLKRLNTKSDEETDTSSESEEFAEKEILNFTKENTITPSKSFLIDHGYSKNRQASSGSPCKNLDIMLKDLVGNEMDINNMTGKLNEKSNTLPSLESDKTTKKCAEDPFVPQILPHATHFLNIQPNNIDPKKSLNSKSVEQPLTVLEDLKMREVDSNSVKLAENKTAASFPQNQLQNSIELKILKDAVKALVESESERASSSSNPSPVPNLIESAETYLQTSSAALNCAKKSEDLRKTNVIDMEVNHSSCTILSNQSRLGIQNDPTQSENLQNITLSQNLTSHSVAENIGTEVEEITAQLSHQNSISYKSNSSSPLTKNGDQNYPGIVYLLPSSSPDITASSGNDTNSSDLKNNGRKFLNVESNKNPVAVQSKVITDECQLISTPSLTVSCTVNECNQAEFGRNELYSENSNPVIKQSDESAKVTTEVSTRIENITSSTILTDGKVINPLYPDLNVNLNSMEISKNTTKKLKEDKPFIPRSLLVRTDKTMYSSDLRDGHQSEKESSLDFQNLEQNSSSERDSNFYISESSTDIFDLESNLNVKRRKIDIPSVQVTENKKVQIDMFDDQTKINLNVMDSSLPPNAVPLPLENSEDPNIGKISITDDEKQENLNEIALKNSLDLTNSVSGFSFDHLAPSTDYQNKTCPFKEQTKVADSTKTQPHAFEFPNASCLKRRHIDSVSQLVSKKARLPKRLEKALKSWNKNFPSIVHSAGNFFSQKETKKGPVSILVNNASSSNNSTELNNLQFCADEKLNRQKETEMQPIDILATNTPKETEIGPVSLLVNDLSTETPYSTGICNLLLAHEIPASGISFDSDKNCSNDGDPKTNNSMESYASNKIPTILESSEVINEDLNTQRETEMSPIRLLVNNDSSSVKSTETHNLHLHADENFSRQTETDLVRQLGDDLSSSVYFSGICNLPLATEISANGKNFECNTNRSNDCNAEMNNSMDLYLTDKIETIGKCPEVSDENLKKQRSTDRCPVGLLINNDSSSGDSTATHNLQLNTDENFRKQKETKTGPVSHPKNDLSSSVYYSGICNLPLNTEILASGKSFEDTTDFSNDTDPKMNSSMDLHLANKIKVIRESPEVIIDHSSNTESKNDISTDLCLNDKIPAIAESCELGIDHSINTNSKTNSLNIISDSESSSSRESSSCQISSSPCKAKNEVLKAVNLYIESVSESEDDIQIIEEACNIKASEKNISNKTLPSDAPDKKPKDPFLNRTSPKLNQRSVKTKHKKSSSSDFIYMPDDQPVSLFNLFKHKINDTRIQKKSVRAGSRIKKKTDNSETHRKYANCNDFKSSKRPSLPKTSLDSETHGSRSIPGPSTKTSRSNNQNEKTHCFDRDDSKDCCIVLSDDDIEIDVTEIVILDSDDDEH